MAQVNDNEQKVAFVTGANSGYGRISSLWVQWVFTYFCG